MRCREIPLEGCVRTCLRKNRDFLEKCSLQASCSIWAALPGAQHLERCFAPKDVFHMTRRAFLALRVIQRHGKSSFNMLVKNWCKWCTKMKISQNLCIRLISDQFSTSPDVKAYPGMHSLCPFMRLRKSYQWRKVRAWCRISWKSSVSDEQVEFWRPCRGLSPGKGFAPNKAIHYMTRRAFLV